MLQCVSPEAAFFQELNGINFANLAKGEIDVKGWTAGWMDGWSQGGRQTETEEWNSTGREIPEGLQQATGGGRAKSRGAGEQRREGSWGRMHILHHWSHWVTNSECSLLLQPPPHSHSYLSQSSPCMDVVSLQCVQCIDVLCLSRELPVYNNNLFVLNIKNLALWFYCHICCCACVLMNIWMCCSLSSCVFEFSIFEKRPSPLSPCFPHLQCDFLHRPHCSNKQPRALPGQKLRGASHFQISAISDMSRGREWESCSRTSSLSAFAKISHGRWDAAADRIDVSTHHCQFLCFICFMAHHFIKKKSLLIRGLNNKRSQNNSLHLCALLFSKLTFIIEAF